MPYYPGLVNMLRVAPQRVNAAGEIQLTATEAAFLRACDFVTAVAGPWKVPPLPAELVRGNLLPAHLADGGRSPAGQVATTIAAAPSRTVANPSGPSAEPASAAARSLPPVPSRRWAPEHTRLRGWIGHGATADQRRILVVLAWHPEDRLRKRSLQQRLHRIPAVRFNAAIRGLIERGLVRREGPWLETSVENRRALIQAGVGVSRRFRARAMADRTLKRRARRPRKRLWYEDRNGCMRCQKAYAHGHRTLAPVGTSAWGRSMRSKKGGYARQRQCRAWGINPTAQATAARLARTRAPRSVSPCGGQPYQPAPHPPAPNIPAAVVPQILGGDGRGAHRRRDASDVTCAGESRLSQAWRQREQPIGRAERLASLRRR